ncbi:angiopoietin-4-like [Clavelina lepadiformis]|uniref:angiopoietin-4-like n=1 Tax=Clavelina lepadiformis TaxID=159417 RepID=UPI00404136C7
MDLFFLLLTFYWENCEAATDQASRLLHRVLKVSGSLRREDLADSECTNIYASGSTSSGIYPIWLKERFQFTYVYCDMELVSTKKGWTTIQRRMNGEVNFNRGWDDYVRGFGNPRGECWLGLENIYRLLRQTAKAIEVNSAHQTLTMMKRNKVIVPEKTSQAGGSMVVAVRT